jgi:hypothetical protein
MNGIARRGVDWLKWKAFAFTISKNPNFWFFDISGFSPFSCDMVNCLRVKIKVNVFWKVLHA